MMPLDFSNPNIISAFAIWTAKHPINGVFCKNHLEHYFLGQTINTIMYVRRFFVKVFNSFGKQEKVHNPLVNNFNKTKANFNIHGELSVRCGLGHVGVSAPAWPLLYLSTFFKQSLTLNGLGAK